MRITSAAMSFVSLPSPKGEAFREGPKKDKRKSRSLSKVFSPIRRMGRQLSKRGSRNSAKKEQGLKHLLERDEEQGWIAPATTFETEDTLSPRSFDTLTTSGSTSLLAQTEVKEGEIVFCSFHDSSQQIDDNESFDLETGSNTSASAIMILQRDNDVQDSTDEIEYNENTPDNCEAQYAAPQVVTENKENMKCTHDEESENKSPTFQDLECDGMTSSLEEARTSMVSLLSHIDTTEVIDESDEIDSLAPAADISFFLNEEDCDDFHCVGRLSTPQNGEHPVEIDIDSIDNLSNNPPSEGESHGMYIEDEDEISLSSYNSYLQAIENISAVASSKVEGAISVAMDALEIEAPSCTPQSVEAEAGPELDIGDEEDCFRVSFNPSRELLLQAMEGASFKAKADIERATALALSKMDSANSASSKRKTTNASNRVLGFLFFVLLILQLSGNSFQLLRGMKSISHAVGIDEFQIQARDAIVKEPHLDRGMWGDRQMVARENETRVAVNNNKRFYNIGCGNKILCLALGNI